MPYEVKNVAKDSVLKYKVVRQIITYETGVETKRDTTWLGQPNENEMTRDNNAWKLDGSNNVKLTADEDGTYTFSFTPIDSVLTVTFPAIKPHLDSVNTIANLKACYEAGTLKDNDTIRVKGYIASMFLKPSNFAKYGSVTIWMTDTLGGKAKEFELFNCYGLEKDTFAYFGPGYNTTGKSSIDVDTIIGRNNVRFVIGDYIEAVGAFKNFSGTFELLGGCNIYEGGEELVRYAKNNWDSEDPNNWTWKEMTYVPQKNKFELNKVVYGGTGINVNTKQDDKDALWIPEADFLGDKIQAKDTVLFVFDPSNSTLTATLISRPVEPTKKYYITGNEALVPSKAWDAKALEMVASVHTFMGMAAGDYQLKITDGEWEPDGHSWGFSSLSETSSEGLSGDAFGNICFTVETPNNVVVSIANGVVTITGTFKKDPVLTYDTTMYVAGNFTNWAEGMQELPYSQSFNKGDSVTFKQVRVIITYADGTESKRDTTWFGQTTEGAYMTRDNVGEGWKLDGQFNVLVETDATGIYTFDLNGESFVVGFPIITAIDQIAAKEANGKFVRDGQLYIKENGVIYNANGARVR